MRLFTSLPVQLFASRIPNEWLYIFFLSPHPYSTTISLYVHPSVKIMIQSRSRPLPTMLLIGWRASAFLCEGGWIGCVRAWVFLFDLAGAWARWLCGYLEISLQTETSFGVPKVSRLAQASVVVEKWREYAAAGMASHCHTVRKLVGLQSKHWLSEVVVQPTTSMTVETMEENLAIDSAALEAVPMNPNYLPLIASHLPPHRHQTTTMMKCYDHPILSSTCQRKANDFQRSTERKYTKK